MNTYLVTPTTGEPSYTIQAKHYSFDPASGRHTLTGSDADDSETIAVLLNVSVAKQPA